MTDQLPTESPDELLPRVTQTQNLQDQAAAVHDQAIRDAKAAGHPMTQIAAALGITNRVRLYGVLDKTYDNPTAPTPTPVVFLRGAGAPKTVWDDIETAMRRRGLMVVKDRQQAWHLARGGVTVVIVDFSRGVRHHGGQSQSPMERRAPTTHHRSDPSQAGTGPAQCSGTGLVDHSKSPSRTARLISRWLIPQRHDTSGTTSSTPNSSPEPSLPNCPESVRHFLGADTDPLTDRYSQGGNHRCGSGYLAGTIGDFRGNLVQHCQLSGLKPRR